MKCPYCNKQISDNTQFCPHCGQSVSIIKSNNSVDKYWNEVNKEDVKRSAQYGAVMSEKDKIANDRRTKTIVTTVLVIIFLLGGIIWFISIQSNSNAKLEEVKQQLPGNTYTCSYSQTESGFWIHYYYYKLEFKDDQVDYYYLTTVGPPEDGEDYELVGTYNYNVTRSMFGKYVINVNGKSFTLEVDEEENPAVPVDISYGA